MNDREAARVEISSDADELAAAVAGELLTRIGAIQAEGRTPVIGLTGGGIADLIHAAVARMSTDPALDSAHEVDWSNVEIFWGDERYVAADSDDRNAVQAARALLDHVPVSLERVHPMPDSSFGDLEDAAAAYGDTVRTFGSGDFDVLMLGLGPDGHIASLFPGFPQLDVDDRIAVAVVDSPKPPPERISLTLPALNHARSVWFVVNGEGKAPAVSRALAGADVHEIPATGVTGSAETVWWLDTEAASQL